MRLAIWILTIAVTGLSFGQLNKRTVWFNGKDDVIIERDIDIAFISGGGAFFSDDVVSEPDRVISSDKFEILIGGKAKSDFTNGTFYPWLGILKENELNTLFNKQSLEDFDPVYAGTAKKLSPVFQGRSFALSQRAAMPKPYREYFAIKEDLKNCGFGEFVRSSGDQFVTVGPVVTSFYRNYILKDKWPNVRYIDPSIYTLISAMKSLPGAGMIYYKDSGTTLGITKIKVDGTLTDIYKDNKDLPNNEFIGAPIETTDVQTGLFQIDRSIKDTVKMVFNLMSAVNFEVEKSFVHAMEGADHNFSKSAFFKDYIIDQPAVQGTVAAMTERSKNPKYSMVMARYNQDSTEVGIGMMVFNEEFTENWGELWKVEDRAKGAGKATIMSQSINRISASYYVGTKETTSGANAHKISVGIIDKEKARVVQLVSVLFSEYDLEFATNIPGGKFKYVDHIVAMNGPKKTYVIGIFEATVDNKVKTFFAVSRFDLDYNNQE
jgi:hypothetical protein